MNPMDSETIRRTFVEYFQQRGHRHLPGASLVPPADTGSLLTLAGMQQITPYFLGVEPAPHPRLVTVQKCFRTPDIDEVGDERHSTFFEMLGNFSVGDYFKRDAVDFACEFLVDICGVDPARLYPSIHPDDAEARDLWRAKGFAPERVVPLAENWWAPGPVGPNGPDSEIYIDRGPQYGKDFPAGGPDRDDRYLETWNLVFMQYNRSPDGTNHPLPRPNIDTGMGLERLALILQDVPTIYETDLYAPIIMKAAGLAGVVYGRDAPTDRALRIIADHSRGVAFLIGDGVLPGNEGRGYVLRRVLRRLIRQGRVLGITRPFATETVGAVIAKMAPSYPELRERQAHILRVVEREEEAFGRTVQAGLVRFAALRDDLRGAGATEIPGEQAFRLYDTFGFPPDLTRELAAEAGFTVDEEGFARAMAAQRAQSRTGAAFDKAAMAHMQALGALGLAPTEFLGYDSTEAAARVVAILGADGPTAGAVAGETVTLFLDRTPFYAESGGQVGDEGIIQSETGVGAVLDTQRPNATLIAHRVRMDEGAVHVGDVVMAAVDVTRRDAIRRNHTATHLIHRALHIVLGEHARQAGSLVAPERLRFDFTHPGALTDAEVRRVAEIVNDQVLLDTPVATRVTSYEDAVAHGAMALFGEKYGDTVREVRVGDYSRELCGGTHVRRTGEIGPVLIVGEESSAAGVRRIEAVTGSVALAQIGALQATVGALAAAFRARPDEVPAKVQALRDENSVQRRQIAALQTQLARANVGDLLARAEPVNGATVLVARSPADDLAAISDQLRDRLGASVIVLGTVREGKPHLLALVSPSLTASVRAGEIVREAAPVIGGRGGGRPERAQGGGTDAEALDAALATARRHILRALGQSG